MRLNRRDAIRLMGLSAAAITVGRTAQDDAQAAVAPAAFGTPSPDGLFILPALGYAYDALEPHIDARTMEIHHTKHHQAYVDNLNKALAGHPDWVNKSVEELLQRLSEVPESIRTAVRNNGGGHANHTLFWKCLSKDGGKEPAEGAFAAAVKQDFGDFAALKEKLTGAGKAVFGSGWAWLSLGPDRKLQVESTPNQDTPIMSGRTPLLGIDVWEHAYYLKNQNRRADYLTAIFNVIDWNFAASRYAALMA